MKLIILFLKWKFSQYVNIEFQNKHNFELNKTFQCINCKSINFTFNVFDDEINIDEAIIYNTSKNKKEIAWLKKNFFKLKNLKILLANMQIHYLFYLDEKKKKMERKVIDSTVIWSNNVM